MNREWEKGSGLTDFSRGWSCLRTEPGVTVAQAESETAHFVPVELPHDWLIYDAKNLYRDGCGWYRKEFSSQELADGAVRHVFLRFDGVYMDTTVYLNEVRLVDWKYGYSAFEAQLTQALREGKNCLLVQVRFQAPNSRWYSGAGIYRKVWLKTCGEVYLPFDGTYVHTEACEGGFLLRVQTEVAGAPADGYFVRYRLREEDKGQEQELGCVPVCAEGQAPECLTEGHVQETSAPEPVSEVSFETTVPSPKLWSIETPQCYRLCVELCREGGQEPVDAQELTVGFRTLTFTTDKGLFLNGEHVKLHGVCEHHDLGCLGAAFHVPAMERKLRLLKKMGCNAIRTSHNMPATEFMELADRMGFLVVDEAFDMWEKAKTQYDYARFFKEWHERDVRSWIRRDRNHPSLLMWSIGNEIYDTHADEHGQEITRELLRCVREHDPQHNAPATIGSNYMPWENARRCADIVKFAGYNYAEKYYAEHHKEHPDWIMYGSETASLVQSRGIYHFPLEQPMLSDEDEQCSALGNATTSWGARSWDRCIADDRDADFILGQFIWSGFDYIGEPTPYHTKNSYFGQIDTAGFPKDAYYVFQAEWTDADKAPMVHLFPYWDFNPGQLIDVRACTNGASVELFVNGSSRGRQYIDHVHGQKLLADWKVAYEPGNITAVAYDAQGAEIARESRFSFGDSRRLVLSADKSVLRADGQDLCFVTVGTVDEAGRPVENAADYVSAQLSGPGRILGMDNGDSTDYDDYKTTVRKLFSGKLLIVVGSTGEEGDIVLTLSGKGLCGESLVLHAQGAEENGDGIADSTLEDCCSRPALLPQRTPIRKLELRAADGQRLTQDRKELTIEAVCYPPDTTDRELVWEAVNAAGIPVGFVRVSAEQTRADGQTARVTALADGAFYVRCMAKADGHVRLISQLELSAEGLGQALLNPYDFVSAGLFDGMLGEVTNGNEKGIATARDGRSGVFFRNVDFGDFGSDEITLPVFALSDDEYKIELWLGEPYTEDGRLVDTLLYQKPSRWNEYQEETYKLPERLKGVVTIGFVMYAKVHLKGFAFATQQKAFARLSGADADRIYGDSFRREKTAIRGIGNNVTLEYGAMDFGTQGTDSIVVCGATPLAVNTIHIHFTDLSGETHNRILEFTGAGAEAAEQSFPIEPLYGSGKAELIFLPGSCFDLEYFRFCPKK